MSTSELSAGPGGCVIARPVSFPPVSIGAIVYFVLGVIVAASQNYFDHLSTVGRLVSALVAVALWPLLLFGIDIRIG